LLVHRIWQSYRVPHQHSQCDHRLEHGEVLPHAPARPAAERAPRIAVPGLLALWGEPLGVEALGLLPELRMAVNHPGCKQHIGPGRDVVPADLVVGDRAPPEQGRRKIQPVGCANSYVAVSWLLVPKLDSVL
jgi:hypothetical protein